ncbi:hypothetical protein EMM73_12600 [Rheinheimera sediminis]|uniref:hypothetical protein n=1 Tax=Rheinheimera sp. YQF-1 TaxID=2499626 RepID=UPI000FDA546C|nr:hypothetical protein [Rheinheimera sp. YQF-1]RVT45541.1 hypothetical protein EMM73_12600 [Rheinheimera sp. YQF-1]
MNKLDEKLQRLYRQSKAEHPMPAQLRQQLLQLKSEQAKTNWTSYWSVVQGLAASVALIWLGQQLWGQPEYYQILVQSDASYHQVQLHTLAKADTASRQTTYQQRYQHYQQARDQLEQSNSLVGQLSFSGQHWQVEVCDQLLVKIDQLLASELQQDLQWRSGQWVELKTGQQGQILAVISGKAPLHCGS